MLKLMLRPVDPIRIFHKGALVATLYCPAGEGGAGVPVCLEGPADTHFVRAKALEKGNRAAYPLGPKSREAMTPRFVPAPGTSRAPRRPESDQYIMPKALRYPPITRG